MLRIRPDQVTVFEAAALRNFEDRMLAHLKNFAPNHSKILTEDEMRLVIRHGMKRAETHRLTSERSIRIYTETMLMLGSGFDTDPQLPWAAELLHDEKSFDESERIDGLQRQAWEYADQVLPDFDKEAGSKSFIEQIRQLRHESEAVLLAAALPEFYERMLTQLNEALPRKCELLGEQSLLRLVNSGIELARDYGITTQRGCAFFVAAMFMLGSGFDKDPQLPWVSTVLNDQSLKGQNEKVDSLLAGTIDCLKRLHHSQRK